MEIKFKNVGQGDSIFIEWKKENTRHFGIIDCNLHGDENPIIDELVSKRVEYLDFVIISHLHFDHYSGGAGLLEHCKANNVKIGIFLHTFSVEYFRILSSILISQRQRNLTNKFFEVFSRIVTTDLVEEIANIEPRLSSLKLSENSTLSFLAPNGKDYLEFSNTQAKFLAKHISSPPSFNSLSTIILIENLKGAIVLTSDATRKSFKRITNKIKANIQLIQVPHHGSKYNLFEPFWKALSFKDKCPAVFSVGNVTKDKLPDKEVVEFFDAEGFHNESTSYVHGIAEFYGQKTLAISTVSLSLSYFSKKMNSTSSATTAKVDKRFIGDKVYYL